ncbi:MetQ/NlpA family ABC transporter substrate-binding protein [Pullulanibacillus sp. KACC 23026]|uniref:MetQ/NlpA family ABC transporter substrate-binding protein n=1 Tax=Pullulanibacillus sp. KACC 23026 TaxID=3028315 RepID=UPI0023AF6FF0|nr:MetQ/NlpA family ABC transporter substrate-binding protein [Pullulanibacillus sp. KACC 23026]WEG12199.1 MetQ/NlpA family ABC transporter substrate-binding protein [Pullulanibacillus sp. KACC 23026]
MKKIIVVVLGLFMLIAASACGSSQNSDSSNSDSNKPVTVKVGISPAELPTWNLVQKLAKKKGIHIQIVKFSDYVQPNIALNNGDIDLNAFQTVIYFDSFKKDHNLDLSAIGTTAIWPMGIYSKKVKSVKDIKDGSQIIVPNDATNESRALALLQKAGLITLKDGYNGTQGIEFIKDNPKHLKITPVDAGQTPRGLDDATASVINCDMAINAGLNPTTDPIFHEDASNKAYVNIIAAKTKDKDNKTYKEIVDIFHEKQVQDFIKKQYKGAAIPVVKPIDQITNYNQ